MTLLSGRRKLLVVGGISAEGDFSDSVLEYDLERDWWMASAAASNGLSFYGHSAVFHAASEVVYIFGGIVEGQNSSTMGGDFLRALHYPSGTWLKLPPASEAFSVEISGNGRRRRRRKAASTSSGFRFRFLHSAVIMENYMLVIGGKTTAGDVDALEVALIYVYQCQMWIRIDMESAGVMGMTGGMGGAAVTAGADGDVFVIGGFQYAKTTKGAPFYVATLPQDYCGLFRDSSHACIGVPGCSHCSIYSGDGANRTICYTNHLGKRPEECYSFETGTLEFNDGATCKSCEELGDCHSCVGRSMCQWCRSEDNCIIGGDSSGCHLSFQWERCRSIHPKEREREGKRECRENRDCRSCKSEEECVWTRRKLQNAEEGDDDRFRWDCLARSAVEMVGGTHLLIPWQCPRVCPERSTCSECLSGSPENADPKCVWSEQSKSCLSPSVLPLHCFGGATCGRLYQESCPPSWEVLFISQVAFPFIFYMYFPGRGENCRV